MAETDNEALNEQNEETISDAEETNDENTDMTEEEIKATEEYLTETDDSQKEETYSGETKASNDETANMTDEEFLVAAESGRTETNDHYFGHKTVQNGNINYIGKDGEIYDSDEIDSEKTGSGLKGTLNYFGDIIGDAFSGHGGVVQEKQREATRLDCISIDEASEYGREVVTDEETGEEAVYIEEFGGTVSEGERQHWSDTDGGNVLGSLGNLVNNSADDWFSSAVHYKGVLGEFDYDTSDWELATKEVSYTDENDEEHTASIPILRYIGTEANGEAINIPDGLKSLDYSFEGTSVYSVPVIPDSVESAHCAFKDCKYLSGFCDSYTKGEFLGAGGAANMSDNLGDASDMFYGCETLDETFGNAGSSLADARGMYAGTRLNGSNWVTGFVSWIGKAPAALTGIILGDDGYTHTETKTAQNNDPSLLTQATGEDMYADSASQGVDAGEGERIDTETEQLKKGANISNTIYENADEINEISAAATDANIANGDVAVVNDVYIATNGTNTTGEITYKDADGEEHTTSDVEESTENTDRNKSSGLLSLVDTAGAVVSEYGIAYLGLGLVTKSKLLKTLGAGGIVAVGQIANIFPNSLSSMLEWVGGALENISPEASSAIEKVAGFFDSGDTDDNRNEKLDDISARIEEAKETNADYKDEKDTTKMALTDTIREQISGNRAIGAIASLDEQHLSTSNDITEQMASNGKYFAQDGAIFSVAKAYTNGETQLFDEQTQNAQTNVQQFTDKYAKWAASSTQDEDGSELSSSQLSSTQKKEVFEEFNTIYSGMQAYCDAATEYYDGTADYDTANTAVSAVMNATMPEYIQMMQDMDAKYDILTDEQREQLDSYDIPGVAKFSEYGYANAGIEDSAEETETTKEQTDNVATDVSDETSSEESDETEETHRGVASGQNQTETSRGEEAEEMFEDVMDEAEEEEENETSGAYTIVDPSLAI